METIINSVPYKIMGTITAIIVYALCLIYCGLFGMLLGWIPAILMGFIWPLPVGALLTIVIIANVGR